MTDERIQILDPATKLSAVLCDCTAAAGALARGHLSGPTASHYLAQALAGVALLGAETSQDEETVTFRLDCPGPLGGFLVEATAAGTLRGYTKQKILNDFDGLGSPQDAKVLGESGTFEIIRSIPGAILASGAVAVGKKVRRRARLRARGARGVSARRRRGRVRGGGGGVCVRRGAEGARVGNGLRAHAPEEDRPPARGGARHDPAFVCVPLQRGARGGDARRDTRGGARRAAATA